MSDHDDFKIQVLRAFVAVYRVHPQLTNLSSAQTHSPEPTRKDADFEGKIASSGGTVTWLYRSGFVTGKLQDANQGSYITGAQLSNGAYAIFRQPHGFDQRPLADVAVEAVDKVDEARLSQLADALMSRLS
jgi:hypothetical protein